MTHPQAAIDAQADFTLAAVENYLDMIGPAGAGVSSAVKLTLDRIRRPA